ncbi:hypothetical protein Cpin_4058 [Chitinophaga pinensis DSM 2588]|uniref:Uncharacterized protein n=1 Tax=Chitinophaga pinensis (strain ATCC 43595 / DSM 2588 / LMG 13176 / NBRC 15968 / NCIMB 11800 / UQM 2034) TaxID=485918 RepID=A0A979GSM4_CHIPD|nr:hypothetical protein Cpin_4058 [Chitinophaga pinensis DSM 2588]
MPEWFKNKLAHYVFVMLLKDTLRKINNKNKPHDTRRKFRLLPLRKLSLMALHLVLQVKGQDLVQLLYKDFLILWRAGKCYNGPDPLRF